ncbi:hypothetical protein ACFLYK_00390 [Candidatus Cloacimonadota bacterium]
MMKKYILIFLIVFNSICLAAFELEDLFRTDHFRYSFNIFNGTGYYPSQTNKEFQYLEKMDLTFGWLNNPYKNTKIWIDLSYKDYLLEKELMLESTGVSHNYRSWEILYMFSSLEYGVASRILDLRVESSNFNQPVIIDYRFQGIQLKKTFDKLLIISSAGGNKLNTALIHAAIAYSTGNLDTELFFIYSGRNDFLNEKSSSIGLEFKCDFDIVFLYSSSNYTRLVESHTERFDTLQEMIIYPISDLYFGSNLIYSVINWDRNRDWQSRTILGCNINKFSIICSYEYQNQEGAVENWGNRKMGILTNFNLNDSISLGLDMNYMHPTYRDDYYLIGLQGKVRYAVD